MRAALMAPLYLSFSWILTVSYQLFTDTAVKTMANVVALWLPSAGAWINANVQLVVFIYAFTWIFVLSSVIPSVILGKERGVLVQYVVVLILTLLAFYMADILQLVGGIQISSVLNAAAFLSNPLLAAVYLAIPYILMIALDIHGKRSAKGRKQLDALVEKAS